MIFYNSLSLWHNMSSFSFGKKNLNLKTTERMKIIKITFVRFKQCFKDMMVKNYLYLAFWQFGAETLRAHKFTCSTYHSVKIGQHMLHSSALFIYQVLLRGKLGAIPSNSKKTTGLGQRLRKGAQELLTYEAPAFKDSHFSYGTTDSLTISVMSISQLRKIDSLAAANTIFLCALEIQFYYLLL